jgi:peroxiredoxin
MPLAEGSLARQLHEVQLATPAALTSAFDQAIEELASSGQAPGLAVGDRAPDFELPDQHGRTVRLSECLEDGPVVVMFYRGDWCPYCNLTLREMQKRLNELRERGADLIAISPQKPSRAVKLAEGEGLAFSVLSDENQVTIDAFRVLYDAPPALKEVFVNTMGFDLSRQNADGTWRLPVPATFLIDRDGVVRVRHVDLDYRRRMDPQDVLDAVAALGTR